MVEKHLPWPGLRRCTFTGLAVAVRGRKLFDPGVRKPKENGGQSCRVRVCQDQPELCVIAVGKCSPCSLSLSGPERHRVVQHFAGTELSTSWCRCGEGSDDKEGCGACGAAAYESSFGPS